MTKQPPKEGFLSSETGLMHGLEDANKRSEQNKSFYDSKYETTYMLDSKVQAHSLTEALRRHKMMK